MYNKMVKKNEDEEKVKKSKKILVRLCLLITLIKCLKGHRSLGSLFVCQNQKVAHSVTESGTFDFGT